MSQAFVREGDGQQFEDIGPSLTALIIFLSKENNGIQVTERRRLTNANGQVVHTMSNGLSYAKDAQGKWQIIE